MAFRNQALPEQIRQGNAAKLTEIGQPPAAYSQGAAAKAKVAAGRWSQGGVEAPAQAAPPWFVAPRPFSEARAANPNVFKDWDDRFTNATDIGFNFRPPPPPPPEPAPGSAPSGVDGGKA